MEDVKVYVVVNLEIKDVDTYIKYEKGFFGFLKAFALEKLVFSMVFITFSKIG